MHTLRAVVYLVFIVGAACAPLLNRYRKAQKRKRWEAIKAARAQTTGERGDDNAGEDETES